MEQNKVNLKPQTIDFNFFAEVAMMAILAIEDYSEVTNSCVDRYAIDIRAKAKTVIGGFTEKELISIFSRCELLPKKDER